MAHEKEKIDCFACRHFYVTWDKKYPKGCRAMGFKTREMPSIAVFKSSGLKCLRYEPKETPALKNR
ncbi:MAG: uracil-DNA glycosylase [Syntrophus sp. (in: bacteria)]|nr:uracil-DNA glycosylase [Syntrophus sp. (in: bacteria)]